MQEPGFGVGEFGNGGDVFFEWGDDELGVAGRELGLKVGAFAFGEGGEEVDGLIDGSDLET